MSSLVSIAKSSPPYAATAKKRKDIHMCNETSPRIGRRTLRYGENPLRRQKLHVKDTVSRGRVFRDHLFIQGRHVGVGLRVDLIDTNAPLAAMLAFHAERRACGAEGRTLDQSILRYHGEVMQQRLLIDKKLHNLATLGLGAGVDGVRGNSGLCRIAVISGCHFPDHKLQNTARS